MSRGLSQQEMSHHLVLAYLHTGDDGKLKFTNSPWVFEEERQFRVQIMSATSGCALPRLEGEAASFRELVDITRGCLSKFCQTPGLPKTVHSVHCKSMVQRLMTFENLRSNPWPVRRFATDPILAFNDLVEVVNAPAIITYAERVAFSPERLRKIMGEENDQDYSNTGITSTLCRLTARITQP